MATLGLAVEEGLAVQVDLQPAIVHGGDCYGELAMKLCEELSRYPSGLRKVSSTDAVLDLQVGLALCHAVIPP